MIKLCVPRGVARTGFITRLATELSSKLSEIIRRPEGYETACSHLVLFRYVTIALPDKPAEALIILRDAKRFAPSFQLAGTKTATESRVMTLVSKNSNWNHVPVLLALLLSSTSTVTAQEQLNRGFQYRIAAMATGEELARQPDLWTLNIEFKTLRMITVNVTDPVTGKMEPTRITYLVYRTWNPGLDQKQRDDIPVNDLDPPLGKSMFMPEFTLVTSDNDRQDVYVDEIIPEAQTAIIKRERQKLLNSIEQIQPVPEAASNGKRPENMIYGVAIWRNVDPEADRFTIYMTGFSNAHIAAAGPDGNELTLRKTVRQRYWRPGDEVETFEKEIRTEDDAVWLYRAEDGSVEQTSASPADQPEEAASEETDSTEGTEEETDNEAQ